MTGGGAVSAKYERAYYADGYRVVIDGVPCKVASKPTKNRMAMLRQNDSFAPVSDTIDGHDSSWRPTKEARFSDDRCKARYVEAMAEMRAAMTEAAPVEAPAVQLDMMDAPAPPIVAIAEPAPVVEMPERPRVRLRLVQGEAIEACPPVVETIEAVENQPEPEPAPIVEMQAPAVAMKRYSVAAWKRDLSRGSHWRKVQIAPDGSESVSPMVRTVALVRSREVGFVHGSPDFLHFVTEGRGNKGLAWQGFPQTKHGQSIAICPRGVTLIHGGGYATRYEPIDRATADAMQADLDRMNAEYEAANAPAVEIDETPPPVAIAEAVAVEPVAVEAPAPVKAVAPVQAVAMPADDSAALIARIAKLESLVDDLMVIALREAPAVAESTLAHDNAEPAPLPADPRARAVVTSRDTRAVEMFDHTRAKRLRMVRRYLAMRAERAAMRERLEQLQRALGEATAAAVVADDNAQARTVALNRDVALWKGRAIEAGYRERTGIAALMSPRPVAKPAPVASGAIIMPVSAGGGARR